MRPLLVFTASDGTSLVLGELPDESLGFEHEGQGPHEPVSGALSVHPITLACEPRFVFAGELSQRPAPAKVDLRLPRDEHSCPVKVAGGHAVWMSFPQPFEAFEAGQSRVTATARAADGSVVAHESTTLTFYAPLG